MADSKNGGKHLQKYKYEAMSNLVLKADRRHTQQRDAATGDPESLAGHVTIRDMGVGAVREAAPAPQVRKRKRTEPAQKSRGGILGQADLLVEGLKYRPRTSATRDVYELLITSVAQKMGSNYGLEVTASATDSVLEFVKDESLTNKEKKREISDILGASVSDEEFNQLLNLSKKLTDYNAQDELDDVADQVAGAMDIDERQGVAVDFSEGEEENDGPTFEVRDGDEDSEEDAVPAGSDEEAPAEKEGSAPGSDVEDGSEEMIIDSVRPDDQRETRQDDLAAHDIDAYWLQRQIGQIYDDAHMQATKTREAEQIMGSDKSLREVENELMELFDYEHSHLITQLVRNRDKVVWATRWQRAAQDASARMAVEREMVNSGHGNILKEFRGRDGTKPFQVKIDPMDLDVKPEPEQMQLVGGRQPRKTLNLDDMKFVEGNHLMTNEKVKLPRGVTKRSLKGYEEIHVPVPEPRKGSNEPPLMPTFKLPDWARTGFGSSEKLNRIQTSCYPSAFEDDGNMLVCAPTGSGKTNVAMLAMLREIGKHRDPETGRIDLDAFKIVYIAPLKALVQEQVGNFGTRLRSYGIHVAELTGDRQLTKQQIAETNVIVTTPEKWDVITRKATDTSYTNLVRLICIDEIHLLHDDRGPVLESIVSRTLRNQEQTGDVVRIVGLSATLPNYGDVAKFLRVDAAKDLHYFDASFRPCPLKQEFIGVTERRPIKQLRTMNEICYVKALEQVEKHQQMLVFVHSRKETAKTAKYIRDKALELETTDKFLGNSPATRAILQEEVSQASNADLKDLMPYGFGIHHAGMTRADRTAVEDLFAARHIQVLVCTATLAWGVNLPAHAVVIKGTQIYSPEKGSWVELSPQDVLQMLGRAGRPQYDTFGEGIIITTHNELPYYLSLMNQQLPIESQFISRLADNLNAEVVLGNIRSRDEGVDWLGFTYLFVRMLRLRSRYFVGPEYDDDELLEQMRVDLIHSAAVVLDRAKLVNYDKRSGRIRSTDLGRIASHYYLTYRSMQTYHTHILHAKTSITPVELFRVFSLSEEFKYIPVRADEKLELAKLLQRVPIPVKETIDEPSCKINVLLQAYVSRLKLEGLALMADLVYVTQSAGRILRALFEIALKAGWAGVAKTALEMCKTAEKRMWPTMSPLRQFPSCSAEIIKKAERIDVPWSAYFDLDPPRMGELLGMPRQGRQVCGLVAKFPRVELSAQVQPVTRSVVRVELTLVPRFEWDDELHGRAEGWWIIVEDCDGEKILFHDRFLLRKEYAVSENNEHHVEFAVEMTEPIPPNYFVTVVSDRWMHAQSQLTLSFQDFILPYKFAAPIRPLNLQPLPVEDLKLPEYKALFPWTHFSKMQTQTFNALFQTDENVFIGSPAGSGKTACAEFALLRCWSKKDCGKAVCLLPFQDQVDARLLWWNKRLSGLAGGKQIAKLTGDTLNDLQRLEKSDLVLATPAQWDMVSRQWQRRRQVQAVRLIIADDLHMLGAHGGYVYEVVITRSKTIASELENGLRIVGLGVPVASATDLGEWFGANKQTIFNFQPNARDIKLHVHVQSFDIPHFPSLMLAMTKPAYQAILQHADEQPAMVFVPSRKQARATAQDLLLACAADGNEGRFLKTEVVQLEPVLARVREKGLADALRHGVAYYHEALSDSDRKIAGSLFSQGAVQVMVVSRDCCWSVQSVAHLVIVMGSQFFEGREHRYVDYPISEVLQMFGHAGRPDVDEEAHGVLMCPQTKKPYYVKFLAEALPVESQLQGYLHDAFVAEISTKTIENTQEASEWTADTYFYRRMLANPSYYGLKSRSDEDISAYLSEQVEQTLEELSEADLIEVEDEQVTPLNAALIAAYYNISFATMQTLLLSLTRTTKFKGMLEIITAATEFEDIQIRRHEDGVLRRIYDRLPIKLATVDYDSPHFKAFLLLQAHFSRMRLPPDIARDQEEIVRKAPGLLSACVDVLSSQGHLNAINAMELSQMVIQALWDKDSPLKQIPHFTDEVVTACNRSGVDDIFKFMETMDPDDANHKSLLKAMSLSQTQLADAAKFTNDHYPDIDVQCEASTLTADTPGQVLVTLSRRLEDDEEPNLRVHAPFFPGERNEGWWVVVGEKSTKTLYAVKKVVVMRTSRVKLEVVVPEAGKKELCVFVISDCYLGVDQEVVLEVEVGEGSEGSEGSEGDEMEE
ncbi:Sec63-domain-containing protein [Piedraia hortae CBS 480.64]|uniref:Sec63-domain-containing protein n=1 Tax=Piedraia hortae CBS 480.64 TaxID=1314780 RepID=A0A6A7C6Z9_9PEZI|nr:Sec63-domain-containing protein [Piedraia hortae CBS 480.64]